MSIISSEATIEGLTGGNLVLVASETQLDEATVAAAIATWDETGLTAVLTERAEVEAFIGETVILTDDFAPVDQLLGR